MSDTPTATAAPIGAPRISEIALVGLERQIANAEAFDAKAWQTLGAGSIVLGLGVAGDVTGAALLAALVPYAIAAAAATICLLPARFDSLPPTDTLWRSYYDLPSETIDHCLVDTICQGHPRNAKVVRRKATLVRAAIAALAIETIALAIAAIAT